MSIYSPASTVREDDKVYVRCDRCGHKSFGTYFGHVGNTAPQSDESRDAWVMHARHVRDVHR